MNNNDIIQLTVREIFEGNDEFLIPMYQRNYAWGESEITQLLQDVIDYHPSNKRKTQRYYIGTLVVYKRHSNSAAMLEVIDGQQRLTTLSLLISFLKNASEKLDQWPDAAGYDVAWYKKLKLKFESRTHSQSTFDIIHKGNFDKRPSENISDKADLNTEIESGYLLIADLLPKKLNESNLSIAAFAEYLFNYVTIMQIAVPHDTDLNHYFEIMNNRGEQLEKHEVLKSRLMDVLSDELDESSEKDECLGVFNSIWQACSDMERYIQSGFSSAHRNVLFGTKDWSTLKIHSFDEILEELGPDLKLGTNEMQPLSAVVLDNSYDLQDESEDQVSERFSSVIDFPNFLLHVLRVMTADDIPLDDKRLLEIFEEQLLVKKEAVRLVKEFIFALLKCRYLVDTFVIKREFIQGTDSWSLKKYKWTRGSVSSREGQSSYSNSFDGDDDLHRKVLVLISAFHVSAPTLVYKHWLNGALYWLYKTAEINAVQYLEYLEGLARAFLVDRFLSLTDSVEYYSIIFENNGQAISGLTDVSAEVETRLSFGNIQNNLVFNYLDYLLWSGAESLDKSYEFTFRSSVEHFYPQNPKDGFDRLEDNILNCFGNLCLISHSKNSRLSNFSPKTKSEYYKEGNYDSLKQKVMMQEPNWDEEAILRHHNDMINLLLNRLNSDEIK